MSRTRKGGKSPGWEPWSNRNERQQPLPVQHDEEETSMSNLPMTDEELAQLDERLSNLDAFYDEYVCFTGNEMRSLRERLRLAENRTATDLEFIKILTETLNTAQEARGIAEAKLADIDACPVNPWEELHYEKGLVKYLREQLRAAEAVCYAAELRARSHLPSFLDRLDEVLGEWRAAKGGQG